MIQSGAGHVLWKVAALYGTSLALTINLKWSHLLAQWTFLSTCWVPGATLGTAWRKQKIQERPSPSPRRVSGSQPFARIWEGARSFLRSSVSSLHLVFQLPMLSTHCWFLCMIQWPKNSSFLIRCLAVISWGLWNIIHWKWTSESESHVWLFVIPWTVACKALLSMEFSRPEYWSG